MTSRHDFDLLQISLENQLPKLSQSVICRLAEACSDRRKKLAFHAPSTDIFLGSMNNGIRKESIRQIEYAITEVGQYAEFITIHTGFVRRFAPRGTLERCIASLRSLAEIAEENGTVLAIENVYEETTDQLLDYLRLADPYPLKLTFDIAHALIYGCMAIDVAFLVFSRHLIDVHLSQPQGKNDAHLALKRSWRVLTKVISAARDANYAGTLTVEALNLSDAENGLEVLHLLKKELI